MRKITLFIFCFFLLSTPCFSENVVSLRLAPIVEMPINSSIFNTGMGAEASLDWSFFQFFNDFNLGFNAGGAFSSLSLPVGDPLNLIESNAGFFLKWRPDDRWAVRTAFSAGIYQYSRAGENDINFLRSLSIGAEYYLTSFISLVTDGSYTNRVFSSEPIKSFNAALGIRLNLTEIMGGRTRVQIEKLEQFRVFPVSWAWYENNPVATVKITNDEPNAITNVNLSIFMESYMSQPWTFATVPKLDPGESIDLPVTVLFNEAMMNLTETVNANGLLEVNYRSLGTRKVSSSTIQMPIFHRNTLSWDDDRRAAAFVSPNDFAVRYFARYVENVLIQNPQSGNIPPNVVKAAALFETLRLYGINYVVVPATSFVNVSADESVLDNVSFPYQALYYRGGDCSYLSILFCSLLEAFGIESAFITIPGHIYVAFDVGSSTWNRGNTNIIEIDGKRWLPLEVTIPREGFNQAWRVGARQWRTAGNNAALYRIRDCWNVYPSVTVPASGDHLPEMPAGSEILGALQRELGAIR